MAFPKTQIAFLAFVFLIPLLLAIENQNKAGAFRIFFAFAFCSNILILYWIPRVMAQYGGTTWTLGIVGLIVLAAYLAVFSGLAGIFIKGKIDHGSVWAAAVWIPLIWISKDLLVEKTFGGFPWCLAGYSQYKNIYFTQLAEIGGIHLISFLVIAINVLLYRFLRTKNRKIVLVLVTAVMIIYGSGYLLLQRQEKIIRAAPLAPGRHYPAQQQP